MQQGVHAIITIRENTAISHYHWVRQCCCCVCVWGGGAEQTLNSALKPIHMCALVKRDLTMMFCCEGAGK